MIKPNLLTTGEDLADMRCNNGKPLFAPTVDTSTGEGSAWKRIVGCEMNDPEALLTNATLRYLSTLSPSRPFFIAMGHHKPHLPWYTPNRFFEQYGDPSQYPVAKVQEYPATADKINWHPWFDQLRISDVEPRRKQQFMRRGYYASVSYYDYHFGQVLDKLEEIGKAQDTVVLATGDHGWHLGERNMWEKKGLDELDCRVPLMIRVPGLQTASRGQRTSAFAEHVDIMPTLIEFAGLPPCTEDLSGQTLGPVIRNPPATGTGVGKAHTFSQFPRCNCSYVSRHDIAGVPCKCTSDIVVDRRRRSSTSRTERARTPTSRRGSAATGRRAQPTSTSACTRSPGSSIVRAPSHFETPRASLTLAASAQGWALASGATAGAIRSGLRGTGRCSSLCGKRCRELSFTSTARFPRTSMATTRSRSTARWIRIARRRR